MIHGDVGYLLKLATSFRAAIMQCNPETLYITLKNFPNGACGDASLLLAKYFENNKGGSFNYMLGQRGRESHAWIQQGSIIADITANQFKDQDIPVFVSLDHSWHSSFNGELQHIADYTIFDPHTSSSLHDSYVKIVSKINPHQA